MQPVHFEDLPRAVQVQLVAGGAFLFGLVCGFVLSEGKTGWIVLQLIAAIGGFLAGLDHAGPRDGALRGLAGGFLFGLGIVIADAVTDKGPVADVPDPIVLLIVLTTVLGAGLGALGGLVGRKIRARESAQAAGPVND
jgi:hypothetical protein